jgi:alpha-glucosidase
MSALHLRDLRGAVVVVAAAAVAVSCSSSASAPAPKVRPPTRPTAEQQANADRLLTGPDWYRHAVFYEAFVRSFADASGDGIGDFDGLRGKLDYLKELGVDALWLMPIMPTPFKDSGYDISDYRATNPDYGTMQSFEALLAAAHAKKMRVFIDLVLNHTSDKHAWFQESRASRTNPKADWYLWSDTPSRADIGCGTNGDQFGTSAWTLDPARGQYYFHRFYPEQPDLNYRNPEVVKETLDVARFWLDKGVDGFRCDVISLLVETAASCAMTAETVAYIKELRKVLDAYPDRAMISEPTNLQDSTAYFGSGRDMFHMSFNFGFGYFWALAFTGQSRKIPLDAFTTASRYPAGAQDATVIGSHDVQRAWSTAGGEAWRYRRAAEVQMTMRGTPFVYYGEEVGLRPGTQIVVDRRDSARTPMTWTRAPGHGFTSGKPWIAFGEAPAETSVEAEDADPDSMLAFYRALLAFRRGHAVWGTGTLKILDLGNERILGYLREAPDEAYAVVVNFSEEDQEGASADLPAAGALAWGEGTLGAGAGGGGRVKVFARGSAIFKLR